MLRNWALALRPTLSLDFLAGLNDSRITYSGGANGTRVNSSGNIVAATTPRFDYDPVTLAAKGLLVEEARTNKNTNYNASPNGSLTNLTKSGDAASVLSEVDDTAALTAAGLGSIGNAKAFLLDNSLGATSAFVTFGGQVGNTNAHCFSVYVRGGTGYAGQPSGTGGVTFTTSSSYVRRTAENWTPAFTTTPALIRADAGQSVYFILNQLEECAFVTSPIVVAGAAVTRTADSAVMTGTNFSDWFNESEGTMVVGFSEYALTAADRYIAEIYADASNKTLSIRTNNTTVLGFTRAAGAFVGDVSSGTVTVNAATKVTYAYKLNDVGLCVNGATVAVDMTVSPLPTAQTVLVIGAFSSGTAQINGHIRTLQYYPRRVSNEQLQALTS